MNVDHEKRLIWRSRVVRYGVPILIALAAVLIISVPLLLINQARWNNIHHTESVQQNAEITALLKEHSSSFAQQEAATKAAAQYDADVKLLAQELVADLQAVCAQTGSNCPPLTIPGSP